MKSVPTTDVNSSLVVVGLFHQESRLHPNLDFHMLGIYTIRESLCEENEAKGVPLVLNHKEMVFPRKHAVCEELRLRIQKCSCICFVLLPL